MRSRSGPRRSPEEAETARRVPFDELPALTFEQLRAVSMFAGLSENILRMAQDPQIGGAPMLP